MANSMVGGALRFALSPLLGKTETNPYSFFQDPSHPFANRTMTNHKFLDVTHGEERNPITRVFKGLAGNLLGDAGQGYQDAASDAVDRI